jgi:membrane-associated protease RseP (regulator of RpoE activity)
MHLKLFLSGLAALLLPCSAWAADPPPFDVLIERVDPVTQNFTIPLPPVFQSRVVRLVGATETEQLAPLQAGGQARQDPPDVLYFQSTPGQAVPFPLGENRLPGDYWLGVGCSPAPPVLRVHLNLPENQGLVVGSVLPESPAAKAGLETNDILLTAGETKIGSVQDLSKAVEAAKETPLKLEIIHAGKAKLLEITPAKRPQNMTFKQEGSPADWKQIEQWVQKMQKGEGADQNRQFHFRVFQPGAILPPGAPVQPPMPGNLSINVNRNGNELAKITVKWNDKTWEGTEKKLAELPDDVRFYVERMLGRGKIEITSPNGNVLSAEAMDLRIPAPPPGTPGAPGPQMQVQPFRSLEERLEEMSRKLDQIQKGLHEQRDEHHPPE